MNNVARSYLWIVWIVLGCGLLCADLGNAVLLTRSVGSALQQRAVIAQDMYLGVLAAFAMTGSQLWLFSRLFSGIPVQDRVVMLLVVPGVLLNCTSNFFVIAGGRPSPDLIVRLQEVFVTSAQTLVGQSFLVFAAILAVLVSFLPEFLLVRGWHERAAR